MTVHLLLLNSSQRHPSWQGVILVPNSCLAHGNGLIISVCHISMVWLPVFGIFNMRTDVDTCKCTQGLYREKSLAAPETQTCISTAPGFSGRHSTICATHIPHRVLHTGITLTPFLCLLYAVWNPFTHFFYSNDTWWIDAKTRLVSWLTTNMNKSRKV